MDWSLSKCSAGATWSVLSFLVDWIMCSLRTQQTSSAEWLDVPTISMRSVVLPEILANNELVREYFFYVPDRNKPADYSDVDQRHVRLLATLYRPTPEAATVR